LRRISARFHRSFPLTAHIFLQPIPDAMATSFQDVVLSFLPFHASKAFVQRCFLESSPDGLPHALQSQACNVVTSSKLLGDDFLSLVAETEMCLSMNECVQCFDFAVVMASCTPCSMEGYVLRSLKKNGIALFVLYAESPMEAQMFRILLDWFFACLPLDLVSMAPWKPEGLWDGHCWIVPVYCMS
jgi:hypothetical protein